MASPSSTLLLRSSDRMSGTADSYSITCPHIPPGPFRITINTVISGLTGPTELQVRGFRASAYSSSVSDSYTTALIIDSGYPVSGVMFCSSVSEQLEIRFVDMVTRQQTSGISEHSLVCTLEAYDWKPC